MTLIIFFSFFLIFVSTNYIWAQQDDSGYRLYPTDDTSIIGNPSDLNDNLQAEKLISDDEKILTIYYSWNQTNNRDFIESVTLLKFDTSSISNWDFFKAKLNMYPTSVDIAQNPKDVNLILVKNNWNEQDVNYANKPEFSNKPIATSPISNPRLVYSWDITDSLREQYRQSEYSVAVALSNAQVNHEEFITFDSKESVHPPYIEILQHNPLFSQSDSSLNANKKTVNLKPTDDAFIVFNLTDPDDIEGYGTLKTGDLDFLKSWYAFNVTEDQEILSSSTYLKFNLSDIESDKVINAQLKLVTKVLISPFEISPHLELSKVDSNDWNEHEINYTNKPSHDKKNIIINKIIPNPDDKQEEWHIWDITELVKQNSGSELSVVYSIRDIYNRAEEVISFHSKETSEENKAPVLKIEYSIDSISEKTSEERIAQLEQTISELQSKENGGCLIATATYGTELAPQVQQLRELRDNTILQTESGQSFMKSFNNFYYSFSPTIADLERQSPIFRETVRIAITPLITSLSILNYADIDSEIEMISYGISIIALNIGMYFVAPAMLVYKARKLYTL